MPSGNSKLSDGIYSGGWAGRGGIKRFRKKKLNQNLPSEFFLIQLRGTVKKITTSGLKDFLSPVLTKEVAL